MSRKLRFMTELVKKVDENTALPLKMVVPVLMVAVTGTWAISRQLTAARETAVKQTSEIKEEIKDIKGDIKDVNRKLDGIWTVGNMQIWAERMRGENPGLKVPDVTKVARETVAMRRGNEGQ